MTVLEKFSPTDIMLTEEQKEDLRDFLFRVAGIKTKTVLRNPSVAKLYEDALQFEEGSMLTSSGALACSSGEKTGRCPKDKRIVDEAESRDNIWWGPVNIKTSEHAFDVNRERAVDYINTRPRVYIFDGYAGWDPKYRIKVRVISVRAYHCMEIFYSLPFY
jgi:phosphoenolpyruvate carboxykinase (ATP)